jgi:Phage derived protein Gp49-like (DUF891)
MRLVRIGRGFWEVQSVADSRGRTVIDKLVALGGGEEAIATALRTGKTSADQRMVIRMLGVLQNDVPANGPPKNSQLSQPLGDGVFEFRIGWGGKKGPVLRVTYFYGTGRRVVVCANAVKKRGEARKVKADAVETLDQYLRDQANGNIQIEDPDRHKENHREQT